MSHKKRFVTKLWEQIIKKNHYQSPPAPIMFTHIPYWFITLFPTDAPWLHSARARAREWWLSDAIHNLAHNCFANTRRVVVWGAISKRRHQTTWRWNARSQGIHIWRVVLRVWVAITHLNTPHRATVSVAHVWLGTFRMFTLRASSPAWVYILYVYAANEAIYYER